MKSTTSKKSLGDPSDYGFITIKLSDDWQGADFIAQHMDGQGFLKFQLKAILPLALNTKAKIFAFVFATMKIGIWFGSA